MKLPAIDELRAIADRYPVDPADVRAAVARIPPAWTMTEATPAGGAFARGNLQVLMSVSRYDDSTGPWLHVSVCRRLGVARYELPDWEDLKRVKHDFIGPDGWAYQVLPPESEYVNQNPYVLHLYACLDRRGALPDFTWGLGIL